MKLVNKFFTLPVEARCLIIIAYVILIIVRIFLWLLPFRIILFLITYLQRFIIQINKQHSPFTADCVCWAVETVSHYVPYSRTCLVRSLAGYLLFSFYGYNGKLQIGVAKDDKKLLAHAWVENEGKTFFEAGDQSSYISLQNTQV